MYDSKTYYKAPPNMCAWDNGLNLKRQHCKYWNGTIKTVTKKLTHEIGTQLNQQNCPPQQTGLKNMSSISKIIHLDFGTCHKTNQNLNSTNNKSQ